MSVSCQHCGAVASYGREISHRSDCTSLTEQRAKEQPPMNEDERHWRRAEAIGGVWARLKMITDARGLAEAKQHARKALDEFRAVGIDLGAAP